jgi:HSP90 family molecular chaperone
MITDVKAFNDAEIASTCEKRIKMRLSDKAQSTIFQMFTKNVYSNPIGTVVREITSNCFDSHVEAGTDNAKNPVIIKHTVDTLTTDEKEETVQHYISFIDNGVGMSPERVENIYGVYFESTTIKLVVLV